MDEAERFERWFARVGAAPDEAAVRFQHPVAALRGRGAEVYVRVLSGSDGPEFAEHGALKALWVAHLGVPAHVVTVEKPEFGDVAKYQASMFCVLDAAFGIRKRPELSYDVYELSDMYVVAIGEPVVLDAAAESLVVHYGDGRRPGDLRVGPLRRLYEPS